MVRVGDDRCGVGELDLIAGPAQHHVGCGHHARRLAVGAEQLVPDPDVAHRGPARRGRQRRIQRQRLAHTRPRRHDDHLTRVQAVGHIVEFGEAGRHAAGQAALGRDRVDLVHRRLQQIFQRHKIFGHPPVGDVVDLGLRPIDDLGDVGALRAGVAVLHDPCPGLHQPP